MDKEIQSKQAEKLIFLLNSFSDLTRNWTVCP